MKRDVTFVNNMNVKTNGYCYIMNRNFMIKRIAYVNELNRLLIVHNNMTMIIRFSLPRRKDSSWMQIVVF